MRMQFLNWEMYVHAKKHHCRCSVTCVGGCSITVESEPWSQNEPLLRYSSVSFLLFIQKQCSQALVKNDVC